MTILKNKIFNHPGGIALIFLLIGVIFYFAFDIAPADLKNQKEMNEAKKDASSEQKEEINVSLTPEQKAELDQLKSDISSTTEPTKKSELFKKLSSFWYKQNQFVHSGNAAIEVAKIENTGDAWGIAGTSFLSGLTEGQEESMKLSCKTKAVSCLNNAIAMDSLNPQHQMNKALCFVKMPEDNPMQGIMLLLELSKKYPEYIPVQITLSQLAIQTGQWDKAYDRLKKVLEAHVNNPDANCLILEVIRQSNRNENQEPYKRYCK